VSHYTGFCSRMAFPLHERLKRPPSLDVRRRLEASQWLTIEPLADWQLKRLRAFSSTLAPRTLLPRDVQGNFTSIQRSLDTTAALPRLP
jgi:phenylacetate-CoA ligase